MQDGPGSCGSVRIVGQNAGRIAPLQPCVSRRSGAEGFEPGARLLRRPRLER
jgi:hypothetical protein